MSVLIFYDVLELHKTASIDEIKSAYKRLALIHHPDKNSDGNDTRFKEISEAYNTLSNPEKRHIYDNPQQQQHHHGQHPFFNFSFNSSVKRKSKNIEIILNITLEESFTGIDKTINFEQKTVCKCCKLCSSCNGATIINFIQQFGPIRHMINIPCNSCSEKGYTIGSDCSVCVGNGNINVPKFINIKGPIGIPDNTIQIVSGGGEHPIESPDNVPGDLVLKIKILDNPIFSRDGLNLRYKVNINWLDSVCGLNLSIPLFDDKDYVLNTREYGILHDNREVILKNKGFIDINGVMGDLVVIFKVNDYMLTDENKIKLKEIFN